MSLKTITVLERARSPVLLTSKSESENLEPDEILSEESYQAPTAKELKSKKTCIIKITQKAKLTRSNLE